MAGAKPLIAVNSHLRVRLFGRLQVETDAANTKADATRFTSRRVQELLCYLVLRGPKPQHRERLADELWGETGALDVRKTLRQATWQLQADLAALVGSNATPVLQVDNEWIQIDPVALLWSDAGALREAHQLVANSNGEDLEPARVDAIVSAASLYRGELLEGWYHDWCIHERERYRAMCLDLLQKLMAHAEHHHHLAEALRYGDAILEEDRAHEHTHLHMMRAHLARGDRTAAIRQFIRCTAALSQEFDVEPGPEIVELYEQARRGAPKANAAPRSAPAVSVVEDDGLEQLMVALSRAHTLLARYLSAHR